MSVIQFNVRDLANVALAAMQPGEADAEGLAEDLALYSKANALAHSTQYRYGAADIREESILEQIWDQTGWIGTGEAELALRVDRGRKVAHLLHYNAVTNAGRDFLPEVDGAPMALVRILSAILG